MGFSIMRESGLPVHRCHFLSTSLCYENWFLIFKWLSHCHGIEEFTVLVCMNAYSLAVVGTVHILRSIMSDYK